MKGKGFIFFNIFVAFMVCFIFGFIMLNIIFPFRYKNHIVKYSELAQVDKVLVASIIYAESKYNSQAVSSKGACGLMQLLPSTAQAFYKGEKEFDRSMLFDAELNIKIGTTYLKYLFEKYKDEVTVLACYNAGENNVISWLKGNKTLEKSQIAYRETQNYVEKVQKVKRYYDIKI